MTREDLVRGSGKDEKGPGKHAADTCQKGGGISKSTDEASHNHWRIAGTRKRNQKKILRRRQKPRNASGYGGERHGKNSRKVHAACLDPRRLRSTQQRGNGCEGGVGGGGGGGGGGAMKRPMPRPASDRPRLSSKVFEGFLLRRRVTGGRSGGKIVFFSSCTSRRTQKSRQRDLEGGGPA